MLTLKKIRVEYLMLVVAWAFWGISHALMWIEGAGHPNYPMILLINFVQTTNCLIINLMAVWLMLVVQRNVQHINKRNFYNALVIIVLSLVAVFINVTSFNLVQGIWKEHVEIFTRTSLYIVNATEKMIFFTGFCAMFFLIRNLKEVKKQQQIAEEAQQKARDAQLQLLQQQLSPHFLFNTLNSLRSLIAIDTHRARDMVTDLSEFLRVTLSSYRLVHNTIADEINLVEYYLKIQKVRFGDDLEYSISVKPELSGFLVPKFIVQPLVENAVKFGMKTSPMPLKIDIIVAGDENRVLIDISNTGALSVSKPESHSSHGLSNTLNRLELMYPGKTHLSLSADNGGVICSISIERQ